MTRVFVRGLGVTCALGRGLPECVRGLERGVGTPAIVTLEGLEERTEVPFYRVEDGAELYDPRRFVQLAGQAAREAVASAELTPAELARAPLLVGSSSFAVAERPAAIERSTAVYSVGLDANLERVRDELGARGEIVVFNTACTSSALALLAARNLIRTGQSDDVLVLGIEAATLTTVAGFAGLQLVAPSVRPFDRRRSGLVLGEAAAAVVLSRKPGGNGLELLGGATGFDGFGVTTANPDGSSIATVQLAALADARVAPRDLCGIKTHGTSSPLNDAGEAAGIRRVFETTPPLCGLKAYVGHTLGACGALELALFGAALRAGFVPATAGFEEFDPELGVRPTTRAFEAQRGAYLLDYFGFGGSNATLVLGVS